MQDGKYITLDLNITQEGNIKVHSQIINDLSSGIYSSPASCVKELVNNAYDADASEVIIRVKPIDDSITIIDDGTGMNAVDFDQNFAWISKSNKRNAGEFSQYKNRPLIGKIGIGFIAVNEICEMLEITSSKRGEGIKFTAEITFSKYNDESEANNGIIKGAYTLFNEEEDTDEHYTIIRLITLKESVKTILDDRQYLSEIIRSKFKNFDDSSFDSMLDLLKSHKSRNLKSFTEDNAYLQFIIDLASYIPVQYIDSGPIVGIRDNVVSEIVQYHKNLNFKVDLDGIYLKKPIYFIADDSSRVISFDETLKTNGINLKFKGYFYVQHGLLVPREQNGVAIRIRMIPVAEQFGYDPTFLRYPNYMDQIFRNWISGEIYIEEGLEDAMNIDRKSFRVTHPHYLALQNFLHEFLRTKVFKVANEIYENAKNARNTVQKSELIKDQKEILNTNKIIIQKSKIKDINKDKLKNPITVLNNSLKSTILEVDETASKQYRKKDWEILENVFIIFELAIKESNGDIEKLRDIFYTKISKWKKIK